MRKLRTLISFMKKLLLLLLLRSITLVAEIIFEIASKKGKDYKGGDFSVYLHGATECLNWILTQLVIWVVSMRFYESSLPVKRLEKSIKKDICECEGPPEKLWLEDRSTRQCFTWISMTVATVATVFSMTFCSIWKDLANDPNPDLDKMKLYLIISGVSFTIVFFFQSIAVTLMIKAYRVIKMAAATLGLSQAKNQTSQLSMMLFITIVVAFSYLIWFIADNTFLFLHYRSGKISEETMLTFC